MGNIAPDSGVPSEDWSYYVPSSKVSHFRDENKKIQLQPYLDRYFEKSVRQNYNTKQFSFYLGYLSHLITDILCRSKLPTLASRRMLLKLYKTGTLWFGK